MNFKNFILNEELSHKEIVNLINRDCSKFLTQSHWKPLYRGMRIYMVEKDIEKAIVSDYREPKDTPKKIHELFNFEFWRKYNVRDIRSKSVFCSGSQDEASYYGKLFVIFPIGKFTYWWSNNIRDLIATFAHYEINFARFNSGETSEDFVHKKIKELLNTEIYINTNLSKAIESGVEIMLLCNSYYFVPIYVYEDIKKDLV